MENKIDMLRRAKVYVVLDRSVVDYTRLFDLLGICVDAGADVNAKDKEGRTALMYAASADSAEVIVSLIQGGADAEAENNSGEIALFMTRKKSKAREELLKYSTQYRSQFLCKINTLFRYLKEYPEITVSYIGREDSGIGKVYYGDGVRLEQHDGLFPEMISVLKTYNVVFTGEFFQSLAECKK